MRKFPKLMLLAPLLLTTAGAVNGQTSRDAAKETQVPVVFSGGHDTDPRDHGRPVILIAAALGVPSEVFRETFRGVHPAHGGGGPTDQQARDNKRVLMAGLSRYGVTNDRLDTVSNYYRYPPGSDELWTTKPASAYALVNNGKIVRYVITDSGSGYSSPPEVSVPGVNSARCRVKLSFDKDMRKNGAIASMQSE